MAVLQPLDAVLQDFDIDAIHIDLLLPPPSFF